MKNDQAHDVAESSFKKRQKRLLEGQKAMAEHNAALRSEDAKTARLRALRLARDAAENAPPAKGTKFSPAKKKIAAASPPVAAAIEPEGDKEQSPQMQSDHLKMAEGDGTRAPSVRTMSNRI